MQMLNFWGNEDLCKLGKKYLDDLLRKFGSFCLQHSKTFDIWLAFLRVTIAELSMLKQVRFFMAHPVEIRSVEQGICPIATAYNNGIAIGGALEKRVPDGSLLSYSK